MARILTDFPNVVPPDDDYPYGRIKDKTAGANGTPVNEFTNGDIHQFFAKLMDEASIVANGLPDNDYSGFQLFLALVKAINLNNSAGVIETGSSANIKTKVVEIGDWDMDTDAQKNVTHGVSDFKKIRSAYAIIRDDSDALYTPLGSVDGAGTPVRGHIAVFQSTTLRLDRTASESYDSTSYNSTGFNRGWVYITYEE